jgi:hypothetical protein
MTVTEIRNNLSERGKPVSRETLYVYFRRFKIKPMGMRQIPARYPDNVPDQILKRLGLIQPHANGKGRR